MKSDSTVLLLKSPEERPLYDHTSQWRSLKFRKPSRVNINKRKLRRKGQRLKNLSEVIRNENYFYSYFLNKFAKSAFPFSLYCTTFKTLLWYNRTHLEQCDGSICEEINCGICHNLKTYKAAKYERVRNKYSGLQLL